jgi:hypothetical protein
VIKNLPILVSEDIPENTILVLSDTHVGTVTGRLSGKHPNISNVPKGTARDYFIKKNTDEWKFEQCRIKEKEVEFKNCDKCNQRFKCWTAGNPQPDAEWIAVEMDYKQIQARMNKVLMEVKHAEDYRQNIKSCEDETTDGYLYPDGQEYFRKMVLQLLETK